MKVGRSITASIEKERCKYNEQSDHQNSVLRNQILHILIVTAKFIDNVGHIL